MKGKHYFLLLKRLGIIVLVYTVCRLLFFGFNYHQFQDASFENILAALLHGIRFDLSIILISNILFIFLSVLPVEGLEQGRYQALLKILFYAVNLPLIFLNLVDLEFFKFTKKRTAFDVIGILPDVQDQSVQLLLNYWYILLIFGGIVFFIRASYPEIHYRNSVNIRKSDAVVVLCTIAALGLFVARGGFQLKPLRPAHAFVLEPNHLGNISLNTPFTFFLTTSFQAVPRKNYFKDPGELLRTIHKEMPAAGKVSRKDNVVILIVESLATEYTGAGNTTSYTPFLDSLAKHGVFFKNNFANGKRSIEAVPAVVAGIPPLMDFPFITSAYQSNEIHGIGSVLSKEGYTTLFFHGGKNGTMGFDAFAKNAGFKQYIGKYEFPYSDDKTVSKWGIYDEPFLQFCNEKIAATQGPFISCIFTLSSHQPYTIPEKYRNKFPKGTLEIHESIGYADYSLKRFFEAAQKEDWYANTLFVITGDHTSLNGNPAYNNPLGQHKVPLIVFHPSRSFKNLNAFKTTQHLDIMPSILDYLGVENEAALYFGQSVFSSSKGTAIIYSNQTYRLIHDDFYVRFREGEASRLYKVNDRKELLPVADRSELKTAYEKELKAYIQYFNNGIIDNNWYSFAQTKNGYLSSRK